MMIIKKILFGLLGLIVILCLVRVKPNRTVYGFYAGECYGNCATMYEVMEKVIRMDSTSFWKIHQIEKLRIYGHKYSEIDNEGNYDNLKLDIPLIMLFEPRTHVGCPDCSDQGGVYLEFTMAGIRRQFFIDPDNLPLYYPDLKTKVKDKIQKVKTELRITPPNISFDR